GARLVGVAASTPDRGRDAARRLGAEAAYGDAAELATSPDVDVVHICTPNHLHAPVAEAALRAGKHVVCEKPLATTAADARRLAALAADSGLVATVPFVYRFYPLVREARVRVGSGAIGSVRLLHGSYLQDWLATEDDDNWRVDPALSGESRAFADIGSHWCDLVEFVSGDRLASVCADAVTAVAERRPAAGAHAFDAAGPAGGVDGSGIDATRRPVTTEDITVVMFRTAGGVSGSVVVSQVSPGRKNRLQIEVAGSEATLSFDQEQPETLWVGRRASSELVVRDPAHLDPAAAPYAVLPPGHPQGYQDCFDAFVDDTHRAIRAGGTDAVDGLPTFADGARAADITAAVLRSARAGTWEEVPPS
ncbi:MAG TPA: Gfo/Idh/MocA family oxidoreductase, partial [Acidimicrobiales bacterium]|nr:Gfo/Idh/MocA family oxidoreductase [Acidimicrobiales bacterium]